jgi:hypothetical protein
VEREIEEAKTEIRNLKPNIAELDEVKDAVKIQKLEAEIQFHRARILKLDDQRFELLKQQTQGQATSNIDLKGLAFEISLLVDKNKFKKPAQVFHNFNEIDHCFKKEKKDADRDSFNVSDISLNRECLANLVYIHDTWELNLDFDVEVENVNEGVGTKDEIEKFMNVVRSLLEATQGLRNLAIVKSESNTAVTREATMTDSFGETKILKATLGDFVVLESSKTNVELLGAFTDPEIQQKTMVIVEYRSSQKNLKQATAQLYITMHIQIRARGLKLPVYGIAIGEPKFGKGNWKMKIIKFDTKNDFFGAVPDGEYDLTMVNFLGVLRAIRNEQQECIYDRSLHAALLQSLEEQEEQAD